MLTQTAEDRLPALLQQQQLLSRDRRAKPLTSSSTQAPSSITEERIGKVLSYLHGNYREQSSITRLAKVAALRPSSLQIVQTSNGLDSK